jgi:hypothetical protein
MPSNHQVLLGLQVRKKNGHVYIGNARVLSADLKAGNGVVHIVNKVLGSIDPFTMRPSDASNNASAVLSATKLTDADIFNATEVTSNQTILSIELLQWLGVFWLENLQAVLLRILGNFCNYMGSSQEIQGHS